MKVGFNKTLGGLMCGLGVFDLVLMTVSGRSMIGTMIAGVACLLSGLLYLARTYFEIFDDVLVVYAALGPVQRRYPFQSAADIRIEGNKVYIGGKKAVTRGIADRREWEKFIAHVQSLPRA